jgi:hypothetical protein
MEATTTTVQFRCYGCFKIITAGKVQDVCHGTGAGHEIDLDSPITPSNLPEAKAWQTHMQRRATRRW